MLNIHTALSQDTTHNDMIDVEPLSLPSLASPTKGHPASPRQPSAAPPQSPRSVNAAPEAAPRPRPTMQLPPDALGKTSVVTASAILSRSGHLHPLPRSRSSRSNSFVGGGDMSYFTAMRRASSADSGTTASEGQPGEDHMPEEEDGDSYFPPMPAVLKDLWNDNTAPPSDKQKNGRQHTGSALEAIGAMFLRQDSAGRLDQLSLARNGKGTSVVSWPLNMPLWLTMFETQAMLLSVRNWMSFAVSLVTSEEEPAKKKKKVPKTHPTPPSGGEELPSTPVAMPGSYAHSVDDGLLLPPPLLDEGSDPRSFEGLLGVRRMREQQQRKKRLDSLRERNRPPHRVDMFTAFSNFVRSAKASEKHRVESNATRRRRLGIGFDFQRNYEGNPTREEAISALRSSEWRAPRLFSAKEPEVEDQGVLSDDESHVKTSALHAERPSMRRRATVQPNQKFGVIEEETLPKVTVKTGAEPNAIQEEIETVPVSAPVSPRPVKQDEPVSEPAAQATYRLTPQVMLDRAQSDSISSPATSKSGRSVSSNDTTSRQQTPTITADISARDANLSAAWVGISFLFVGVTFVPDFVVFLLAHFLDVFMDVYEVLSQAVWFLRWLWLNGTGQTVLGRCAYEAYKFFQSEWAYVAREDHEARSERRRHMRGLPAIRKRRGLSVFQVIRGILELACIQAVTRERFQEQGAGLERLTGWRKHTSTCPPTPAMPAQDEPDEENDDDDDDLVVTSRTNDILEISRTTTKAHEARRASLHNDMILQKQDPARGLWDEDNSMLVRNVKWASQLAMSAYGLQVLIVDLPPVFTPSGRQFPQQTFAHLSRLDADDVLHADIQTLDVEATYSPTFYIVRDMRRKVVCVAVRGTQSFADIVVDLDLRTEDVTSELPEWRGMEREKHSEHFAYHAGIWRAARELVKPGSTLFCKLRDTLNDHPDFGLVFVGHSLGGAIASAAAILLSEYHMDEQDTQADPKQGVWRTVGTGGFPADRRIRAITFAHPAALSVNLSARTSFGAVPLVTTIIYGSDIIPRFGHGQVRELRRVLGALTRVRRRRAMETTTISSNPGHAPERESAVVHVLWRFWDWLSICRNDRPDAVMLDRKRRLEDLFWRLRCEVEDDLYSQAKRRFDEAHSLQSAPNSPWISAQNPGEVDLHTLSSRRQRLDDATLSNETALGGPLVPAGRILWLEKGELFDVMNPLTFFGLPDLQSTMFLDHFPAAYEEAILALGRRESVPERSES